MFQSARLKLTGWYLLIIMMISGLFSAVIYTDINQEYNRIETLQRSRLEREQQLGLIPYYEQWRQERLNRGIPTPALSAENDLELILGARTRLQVILVLINLGILTVAGFLSYFLAGRTLQPIKEMVEEQNRFITDASHELRTPLASLRSEIEVNLRDKKITPATKQILSSNLEEVDRLQNLSDSLIKLSQYQKSNGQSKFEIVSLQDIANQAQKSVAILAKNKQIKIDNQVKNEKLQASPASLTEALVIFLDNAIKYSPAKTKISLISQKQDHTIKLSIVDQGVGIDPKDIGHLFDRFFRADKSRSTQTQGYGLGLSIAKQIIDKHQGEIKIESQPGMGTTFDIILPVKQTAKIF